MYVMLNKLCQKTMIIRHGNRFRLLIRGHRIQCPNKYLHTVTQICTNCSETDKENNNTKSFEERETKSSLRTKCERPYIKNVLILDKLSRLEVLLECLPNLSDSDTNKLKQTFPGVWDTYEAHRSNLNAFVNILRNKYKINVQMTKATRCNVSNVNTYDAVISCGGDGTYLEAAGVIPPLNNLDKAKIHTIKDVESFNNHFLKTKSDTETFKGIIGGKQLSLVNKPVWLFGINTDPVRSEGRLCMRDSRNTLENRSINHNPFAYCDPKSGNIGMDKMYRLSRLKTDSNIDEDLAVHTASVEAAARRIVNGDFNVIKRSRIRATLHGVNNIEMNTNKDNSNQNGVILSRRAVNDVMIAEDSCNAATYAEVSIDNSEFQRMKNSGILASTGTGSSAWIFNTCKIHTADVELVLKGFLDTQSQSIKEQTKIPDSETLAKRINSTLMFDPESSLIRYVFREPVENRVFGIRQSAGFCNDIIVKVLSNDTHIYIDGVKSHRVESGSTVHLQIYKEDSVFTTY